VIWTKTGTVGATLFYTLSGFLIGGILLDQGDSQRDSGVAARFWLRRALRNLPNYFAFIGVNVVFWFIFQRQRGCPDPVPLLPRYFLFPQNFALKQNWLFAESWSLSVEEWFYLVFPLGLFLGLRLMKVPFGHLYGTLALVMIALSLALRGLTLSQRKGSMA
jgi:peptidoglycan/LPS O-acetylase OafA/YrhL